MNTRVNQHINYLKSSNHVNKRMQELWNDYPEIKFWDFKVVENTEEPLRREQEIINERSESDIHNHLLNIRRKDYKTLSITPGLKAELTRISNKLEVDVNLFASKLLENSLSNYHNLLSLNTKNDEQLTQVENPIKKDESKLEILTPSLSTSTLVSIPKSKPRSRVRKKRNCIMTKFYRGITSRFPNNEIPIGVLKNTHVFNGDVTPNEEDIGKTYKGKDGSQWTYLGWGKAPLSGVKSKLFKLIKKPSYT
jgi:hypothetical protein